MNSGNLRKTTGRSILFTCIFFSTSSLQCLEDEGQEWLYTAGYRTVGVFLKHIFLFWCIFCCFTFAKAVPP